MRGTIRERGKNRWQVQVYAGRDPATGRERRRARTIEGTRRDAERALTKLLAQVDNERPERPRADITVAELVNRWVAHKAASWSPKTLYETPALLERHALPTIGGLHLDELRPVDLDHLYQQLLADGVGRSSIRAVHRWMHAALATAVRWDLIATNPADRAEPPAHRPRPVTPPSPDEAVRLLTAAAAIGPDIAAYVRLSATTGARRGSVCALRWADIDLDARTVTIERALTYGPDGWQLKSTKTGQTARPAIDDGTAAVLAAWRRTSAAAHLEAGQPLEWVFPAPKNLARPVDPDRMTRVWDRVRSRAGLPDVRLHDLRHFVATQGVNVADVRTVAGRLGHADPNLTLRTYAHFIDDADRRLAERLGDILDGDGSA